MNRIIPFIAIVLFSCGKPKYEDNTHIYWDEVNRKNEHFLKMINGHREIGLYEDFDFWNLTPLNKITEVRKDLDFPFIETRNKNKRISSLIVHSNYQHSDTLELTYKPEYCLMKGYLGCFCSNSIFTELYIYPDSLLYFGYSDNGENDPPLLVVSKVWRTNKGILYLYISDNDSINSLLHNYGRNRISSNIHQIPTCFGVTYKESYLARNDKFNVRFFSEKYFYTSDTSEFSEYAHYYGNDDSSITEFYSYNDYNPNSSIFPSLNKNIEHKKECETGLYKSLFWFIWHTRLKNTATICQGGCP